VVAGWCRLGGCERSAIRCVTGWSAGECRPRRRFRPSVARIVVGFGWFRWFGFGRIVGRWRWIAHFPGGESEFVGRVRRAAHGRVAVLEFEFRCEELGVLGFDGFDE
jgi:hypothetical protein